MRALEAEIESKLCVVLLGFLTGLGIGPPIYGATVDATGSYTAMWLLSIGAAATTVVLVSLWQRNRAGARSASG